MYLKDLQELTYKLGNHWKIHNGLHRDPIVRTCACGRKYTFEGFRKLVYVGTFKDDLPYLELRNCACRSTIAIWVNPGGELYTQKEVSK